MGTITGALGLGGGAGGTGFAGPQMADIKNPVSQEQINASYQGVQGSLGAQQRLLDAINAQQGIQKQSDVYNQFQNVAAGRGPNPAQAMLNQATGANVANQAALMASQRGAGANVGLMARQAAQAGAGIQQNAAGQGATMQAQQSMNAMQAAGNMANQQAAQQIGGTENLTNAQLNQQGALLGAQNAYNQSLVGAQSSVNSANAGLAGQVMQNQGKMLGGIGNAVGAGLNMAIPGLKMAEGGAVPAGPRSFVGQHLHKMAQGGDVNAVVSPGEIYLPPEGVSEVARGASPFKVGEVIPGKPKVGGAKNSYANDTVPKKLESGGIVVPRSETKSKNPEKNSRKFVEAVLAKRKVKGRK